MALITKSDFSAYVQFTLNTKDRLIDFCITKAETLDFKPLVSADFWTLINGGSPAMGTELEDFFNGYIKPLIVHYAMNRFLIEVGVNQTQFGLVNPLEDTSQPASDQQRASMRNQYKRDLDSYLSIFYARLKEVEYTFDGTVYDFDCRRKGQQIIIKAI